MDCVRHLGHCGEQKRTSIQPLPCPYEKKDRERKKKYQSLWSSHSSGGTKTKQHKQDNNLRYIKRVNSLCTKKGE